MTLPYWRPVRYSQEKKIIRLGDGINTAVPPFDIADSEATYLRNIGSSDYPALSVRPGRALYGTTSENTTSPNGLGQRNNAQMHMADGNTWKYRAVASTAWTNLTTTLTSTNPVEFDEFVTGTARYTLLMNSTQKLIWDGTSTALVLGDANTPFTDKFAVHKGRIYALDGASVDFCALNVTSDWTTADDAGSITITRAKGPGTGIVTFRDRIVAFTEYSMHLLLGTGPTDYELVDVEGNVGCISHRSIAICNNSLYWLWYDGVYQWSGGVPQKISHAIDEYIYNINTTYKTKCVAGAVDNYLYLSIPYGSSATRNNLLLVYDANLGKWYVETGEFDDFVLIQNTLYGVDKNGVIYKLRTGTDDAGTAINWEFITKPFNHGAIREKKAISELYCVVDRSTSSTSFSIGYSTNVENNDSSSFTTIASTANVTASSNIQNSRTLIPLNQLEDVNWYRLRFAGAGQCRVHFLEEVLRIKAR